jgi:hypothetical protein
MKYNGINIRDAEDVEPGRYFLILVEPQDAEDYYILSRTPGRTNQSRDIKLRGWLGTTNNTSRTAHGAVEVSRDDAGRLRVRRSDAEALLDELETGRGRPSRSVVGPATERVELRLTSEEKARLQALAKAEDVDVSTYVRRRVF